jgi:hypothetical protein
MLGGLRALLVRIKHFEFFAGEVVEMLIGPMRSTGTRGPSTAFGWRLTSLRMTTEEE